MNLTLRILVVLFFCLFELISCGWAQSNLKQKTLLSQMLRVFPQSELWEKWLGTSGELPPDFDALPPVAYLPDPLRFADGQAVLTAPQWIQRRQELLALFRRY